MDVDTAKALKILQDQVKAVVAGVKELAKEIEEDTDDIKELKQGAKDLDHRVAQLEKGKK